MKKIFALALAATMASGMTSVAFAATEKVVNVEFTGDAYYDVNDDGIIAAGETFKIDLGNTDPSADTLGTVVIPGGTTVYLKLQADYEADNVATDTGVAVKKLSDVSKWKIATDWTVGDKAEAPKFVNTKIDGSYGIYLALEVPENDSVKNKDLLGTIGLGKTSTEAKKAVDEALAKLSITYGRDKTSDAYGNILDNFTGDFGDKTSGGVVDFDNDVDEIDIEFNDLAMFTVDVRGQSNLDLRFNTKFNAEFGDMYDYANIDFLTFSGSPRFNRTGTMVIYCENEDAFIYEVTADGAKEIRGAKYDEDEGGFVFKTRALGSYAISDVELDETVVTEDKEESSKPASSNSGNSGKPNPDTGR